MAFKLLADISRLLNPTRQLFFRKECKIGELVIDVSLKQEIKYSNVITEFPVENGSSITDHIIVKPTRLVLSGMIIDSTFDIYGNVQKITNLFTTNPINNLTNLVKGVSAKQITAYQILQTLWQNKSLVTVTFKLDVFPNMVIEDLSFTSDNGTIDNLPFEITLVQMKQAEVENVYISRNRNVNNSLKGLATPKSIFGKQESKQPTENQKSFLFDKIGDKVKKNKSWF